MEARSLQFIAAACGGEPLSGSPDTLISRVCTDSRQVRPGDLFFALPGERLDGHAFLPEVASKGAAAAIVARRQAPPSLPNCALIAVDNTRHALGRLATRYRQDFSLPIVAVGGSNGKTTTKELVASVLRQTLATLWSEGSFNNDIGVPLSLLGLETAHQAAVLEAGTNHPGELAPLLNMICPRLGVLTGIAREHLEFFGDLAGVAQEEGWLAEMLPAGGILFANGDCEWTAPIARRTRAALVRVGLSPANDWRAGSLRPDKQGVTFRVEGPRADLAGEFRINLLGRHQVVNALFALAVGCELGLGRAEIARGLAHCKPAKMRLQLWELNGVCLLDDAYNANADSMLAALQTLQELPCKGRRVAVLGDMAELGAQGAAAHEEVGRHAAELGVSQLFAVGKMAPWLARGARGAGLSRVLEFADVEGAGVALKQFLKKGDMVLLKASRATRLERIAERLRGGEVVKRN
ncbi:MAG: UDP-N-acetylmuramoyl-tripeptide--D-alanyl-D-alanine ligase [Verrucomicrobiota bacterium]|jgi:UDP-N-acetylmuramoyl-tripeptide--D-alanyl-D-alanine ligase